MKKNILEVLNIDTRKNREIINDIGTFITLASLSEKKRENIAKDMIKELGDSWSCSIIINKRIKAFELSDKVSPSALLFAEMLNLKSPADSVIFLIDTLIYQEHVGKFIKIDWDLCVELYPSDFCSKFKLN